MRRQHAPAAGDSFFLCLIGYWSQSILGGGYALAKAQMETGDWRSAARGSWSTRIIKVLLLSALFDAAAQALDYVGQVQGGYMLFTIFHSSVTVFTCAIAVAVLKTKITWPQWGGVALIVGGVFVTAVPNPIAVPDDGSFWGGLICSVVGSLSLAASYPFSELVFKRGEAEEGGAISEEMVSTQHQPLHPPILLAGLRLLTRWRCGHRRAAWARCSTRRSTRSGRWHTPVSPAAA